MTYVFNVYLALNSLEESQESEDHLEYPSHFLLFPWSVSTG